jgi:EpsI family protein
MKAQHSSNRSRLALGAAVAFGVLLAGGIGQRWLERLLVAADAVAVPLKHPLSTLPLRVGAWQGTEMPLDKRVVEVAGSDDYVSRCYTEDGTGRSVNLYVSYAARPAKMLGHRPQVCYPAHGWAHAETHNGRIDLPGGQGIDCLIHRFTRKDPVPETVLVLNYYILRGRYTTEWTEFWGPNWRLPNLSRDPNFYVCQVQVSTGTPLGTTGAAEEAIRSFAAGIAPAIQARLPGARSEPRG